MKLAFSTLGCPNWTVEEVVEAACRYGFNGIELRGIKGELDIRRSPDFFPERIKKTRALFEDSALEIISIDSSASFSWQEPEKIKNSMNEAQDYILLANQLGAPFVRVFGGYIPEDAPLSQGIQQLADNLSLLGDYAHENDIIVLLETHDSFLSGNIVSKVMKKTHHKAVGVVWDVSNCFWTGEPIKDTAEFLAPYLKHIHIKDSIQEGKEAKLTFIGQGDVPVYEVIQVLSSIGYTGYLSYEWEKVWQPDLPEADEAFPQFVKKMKEYLK